MTNQPDSPNDHHEPVRREPAGRWFLLLPAAALVLGLVLGGLVVGVAVDGDDGGAGDDPDTTPSAPSTTGDGTAVVVPDSCLEAADTVREAITALEDGLGAVQEFQPDRILQLLNELEDLEAQARAQAETCEGTRVQDTPTGSDPGTATSPAETTPTDEPTDEPATATP